MSSQEDLTNHATVLAPQLGGLSLSSRSSSWTKLTSDNSIRLLQLKPAVANEDPLRCTLVEIQLTEPSRTYEVVEEPDNSSVGSVDSDGEWEDVEESGHPSPSVEEPTQPFEAISYACGDFHPSVPLYINHDAQVLITPHLAAALRCLRYDDRDRFLWVDTVCINQSDNEEKSHQVAIMHRIYRAATKIQIWLGEADDHTEHAFAAIHEIAAERSSYGVDPNETMFQQNTEYTQPQLKVIRKLLEDEERMSAVDSVLERDYFHRRWIVQETALARDIGINCGPYYMSWETLTHLIAVLRLTTTVISTSEVKTREHHSHAAAFTVLKAFFDHQDTSRPRIGKRSDTNLISLLQEHESSLCRDDHDLIYALLGAAEDILLDFATSLQPDYSLSIDVLFRDLAMVYLANGQDVRILHHVRNNKTMVPTFVPDWRVPNKTEQLGGYRWITYKAGIGEYDQPAQVVVSADGEYPVVLGWYVDEIRLSDFPHFAPDQSWGSQVFHAQLACWLILSWYNLYERFRHPDFDYYPFTEELTTVAFARTLVADNALAKTKYFLASDVSSDSVTEQLHHVLNGLRTHTTSQADADTGRFDTKAFLQALHAGDDSDDFEERSRANGLLRFLMAVATIAEERCFFLTPNNLIGVGPLDCQPGDVVALIAGAETPFVLRPVVGESEFTDPSYQPVPYRLMRRDTGGHSYEVDLDGHPTLELDRPIVNASEAGGSAKPDSASPPQPQPPEPSGLPAPEHEKTNVYTVIGECYVHGIMDGSFMRFTERLRMFELR